MRKNRPEAKELPSSLQVDAWVMKGWLCEFFGAQICTSRVLRPVGFKNLRLFCSVWVGAFREVALVVPGNFS